MRLSYFQSPSLSSIPHGQDGNFESNGDIKHDYFEPNLDGFCYKFFNNFIVNSGHVISTTIPCKGLYIYVNNLAIVNGSINMNYKGVYSPPTGNFINGYTPLGLQYLFNSNSKLLDISLPGSGKLAAGTINGSNGGLGGGSQAYNSTGAGMAGVFGSGSGAGAGCRFGHYYCPHGSSISSTSYSEGNGNSAQAYASLGGLYSLNPTTYNNSYPLNVGGSGQGYPKVLYYDREKNIEIEEGTLGINVGVAGVIYLICNILNNSFGSLISTGSKPPINNSNYKSNNPTAGSSGSTHIYYTWSYPSGTSGGGSVTLLYRKKINSILTFNVSGAETGSYNNAPSYKSGNGSKREFQYI